MGAQAFAAAWFTGVTLAVALSPVVYGNPLAEYFLAFGAGGVVIGVITGLALVFQIRIGGGPERGSLLAAVVLGVMTSLPHILGAAGMPG